MNMKCTATLLFFIPLLLTAQSLENQFDNLLDSVYNSNKDALGILIHVESPDRNVS